ncbi:MAG: TIGR01777 family oxidoreductase [Candidatus Acidiferrales bacterium]
MRILISGSSGLIGTAVADALVRHGHTVQRLVRPASKSRADLGGVRWDPASGELEAAAAEGAEAVVNLAGASIGEGRWTAARKQLLRSSRTESTRNLIGALGKLQKPPRVFVSASAVGYFGDRGDEELTEESIAGGDFLATLCKDWENEAAAAANFGARTVCTRFGIVLARGGGALPRMVLPFKLGVGGRLGSGKQWMSWATLAEVANIVKFVLENESFSGAVNAVAPQPVRNAEFTKTLASVLHRPAIFPAPAFALKLALGEMAQGLLLSGQRVLPARLLAAGYRFQTTDLRAALREVLSK